MKRSKKKKIQYSWSTQLHLLNPDSKLKSCKALDGDHSIMENPKRLSLFASDIGIVRECEGCPRIQWGQICSTYREPKIWWLGGNRGCPFHPKTIDRTMAHRDTVPAFVDPLKASKMRARGK